MLSPHIFRANDIRGHYNKDFNRSFTKQLAFALCKLCQKKNISRPQFLIGQDSRLSSPEISQALIQHLKNQGAYVAFIGLAPSPLCYFLQEHHNLTACVAVTASHNPVEDNGFKILFHKKHNLPDPIPLLKKIILYKKPGPKKVFKQKGTMFKVEKEGSYISSLKKEFALKNIPLVVDTGNGALGPLAKKAFLALGLKPKFLFCKPNGLFPHHHPDPTEEKNLIHLKKAVKKEKARLGFAFDGDGDRLTVVNKQGKTILGDELGFLLLNSLDKGSKKSPLVLADVKCSDWLFRLAKRQGFKILMTKSGHGLIKKELRKTKALFAVEFSGHIFFNDRKNRGFDDALYASLRLLELLNREKKSLSFFMPKKTGFSTKEIRLLLPESQIKKSLLRVKSYLTQKKESFLLIDGLRLSRAKSGALFRGSKTQSALTMRFSAQTKKELNQIKKEFSLVMDLKIP